VLVSESRRARRVRRSQFGCAAFSSSVSLLTNSSEFVCIGLQFSPSCDQPAQECDRFTAAVALAESPTRARHGQVGDMTAAAGACAQTSAAFGPRGRAQLRVPRVTHLGCRSEVRGRRDAAISRPACRSSCTRGWTCSSTASVQMSTVLGRAAWPIASDPLRLLPPSQSASSADSQGRCC
jgi:hypothetical protein